jgi:hypothetical protein
MLPEEFSEMKDKVDFLGDIEKKLTDEIGNKMKEMGDKKSPPTQDGQTGTQKPPQERGEVVKQDGSIDRKGL